MIIIGICISDIGAILHYTVKLKMVIKDNTIKNNFAVIICCTDMKLLILPNVVCESVRLLLLLFN